jgi:hypothetical protein
MNELQVTHNQIAERVKNLEEQITIVDSGKRFYDEASQGQTGNILQLGDNIFSKYGEFTIVSIWVHIYLPIINRSMF